VSERPEPTPALPPSVSRRQIDVSRKALENAILDLCRVVDTLSQSAPEPADHYRVTIFGSARLQKDNPWYGEVRRFAKELARLGCDIVTGGGPGLMEAANEGETIGDVRQQTRSYGLRVDLAFEQKSNPYVENLYHHSTFFSRLHHFVRLSSAYVVVPGGIGTTLELALVWQLLQVRHLHDKPLILVGSMWKQLVEWARQEMTTTQPPLADDADVAIPTCVDTVDNALGLIIEHRQKWLLART
jgi:uncharacterized protein (TIGR00730 family)